MAEARLNYVLQDSRSFSGNCIMFWAERGGYTSNLLDAKRYTHEDAFKQHLVRPTDVPWPLEYLQGKIQHTVDHQHAKLHEAIRSDVFSGIMRRKQEYLHGTAT